jgi:16S rRNA (guanine966-N2)-methyltransferase
MRITSGKYKNKPILTKLKGVEAKYRPTAERTRMAIFNMINHSRFASERILDGAIVADICCGSGSFGIEALSRGAAKVYFIDKDIAQIKLAKANIANIREEENSVFISADATNMMPLADKFNIIFIDPPYSLNIASKILEFISRSAEFMLAPRHMIILEISTREEILFPKGFIVHEVRRYGRTQVIFGEFKI